MADLYTAAAHWQWALDAASSAVDQIRSGKAVDRVSAVAGADDVLLWTTGYPFAVNLARGYPRFGPGEFSANDALARREVADDDRGQGIGPAHIADLTSI